MSKAERDDAYRVFRGASWFNSPAFARLASRSRRDPRHRYIDLSVRLARRRSALERLADGLREVSDGQEEEG